ncbi:hypothetical protein CEXT_724641 [Caerostris extrusa]|uniref:Uncharacterized protein n=1 Tax=Caerostris extrusa TaxID=172846 RepID=A0AAV4WAS1_CAEEX|nr:hypothetical protein CEXT_724641 [Caerostris extrusa]
MLQTRSTAPEVTVLACQNSLACQFAGNCISQTHTHGDYFYYKTELDNFGRNHEPTSFRNLQHLLLPLSTFPICPCALVHTTRRKLLKRHREARMYAMEVLDESSVWCTITADIDSDSEILVNHRWTNSPTPANPTKQRATNDFEARTHSKHLLHKNKNPPNPNQGALGETRGRRLQRREGGTASRNKRPRSQKEESAERGERK